MHFITKRVVKNHFEVKFTKKLPLDYVINVFYLQLTPNKFHYSYSQKLANSNHLSSI